MSTQTSSAASPPDAAARPRRHVCNFIAAGCLQLIAVVAPLLILLLMARAYDLDSFGRYSVALAFVNLMSVFFALGVGSTVCFQVAETKPRDYSKQDAICCAGFLSLLVFSLVASPFLVIVPLLLGYDSQVLQLILILSVGYWFTVVTDMMNAVFRGRREMHWPLFPAAMVGITTAVVVTPLLLAHESLPKVACVWSCCQLLGPLTAGLCLRRAGLLRSVQGLGAQLPLIMRRSLTIGLDSILYRMGVQTVTIMLPVLLTVREAGIFNAASKPLALMVMGNQFIMQFFSPYIASVRYAEREHLTKRIQLCHKMAFFFTGSVLVGALVFPDVICQLLFGAKGHQMADYMQLLSLAFIIYYAPPYSANLKAIGLERQVLWCAVVQWITMVVALLCLAPSMGVWGAVIATLLAYSAYWLTEVALYSLNRLQAVDGISRYLAYLACTSGCGFLLHALMDRNMSIVLYGVGVTLFSFTVYWTPFEIGHARWLLRSSLFPRKA
ncbi:oligosaccharide flippase family protein [Roseimaritima ulvae]|uniref:oligosaccharide flippase family protein n=1 Tax=Roseimaritima ulvae TaxID=980254 RepID=UPI0013906D53|nr:oligosaccharide flippase family protein [Roseimaritima ulvae]